MFTDKAKQLIDAHTIISFDSVDTLLIRPYLHPADLFVRLEKREKHPSFAKHRRTTETRTRQAHADPEDIHIDEIYKELSGRAVSLKEAEMTPERQTQQANPEMLEVFNYAKENGFDGFAKRYESNGPRKNGRCLLLSSGIRSGYAYRSQRHRGGERKAPAPAV